MARSKFSNNQFSTHRIRKLNKKHIQLQNDKAREQETYGAEYTFTHEELSRIKYK